MWKMLTGIISREMYSFLETDEGLLPEEQKGCRRGSRGTNDQLYIDKHAKRIWPWVGSTIKKAFDIIPHSWILECRAVWSRREHTGTTGKQYEELANRTNFKWAKARGSKHHKRTFSRRLPIATFVCNSLYHSITNFQKGHCRVSVCRQNKDQSAALHG